MKMFRVLMNCPHVGQGAPSSSSEITHVRSDTSSFYCDPKTVKSCRKPNKKNNAADFSNISID